MSKTTNLATLLALAMMVAPPRPAAADQPPPGPFKKYKKGVVKWSSPAAGFALMLAPNNPTLFEGSDPSTDTSARMDCTLILKNVSKKRLTFQRKVVGAFQLKWDITDARGRRWSATFLPPPMPRPGPPPKVLKLGPGQAAVLASLHGISGFRRAGKRDDGRWYNVPPAGTYTVVARGVDLGTMKKKLASGAMTITVRPADRPVRGLRLQLTAASRETPRTRGKHGARPVKLELSFVNVGKKPITLDTYQLRYGLLKPHVKGNLSHTKTRRRAPPPRRPGAGFEVIKPGKRYVFTGLQAPGPLGRNTYRFSDAGWYQLRLEYARYGPAENGCWTGKVSSNVVWLKVKP